jgi:hypothetical protein
MQGHLVNAIGASQDRSGEQMDYPTFFASVIGSLVKLAWPAALFGAVWIFRDKIEGLLPFIRLKYKDLDISFRFEEAEKEAARLPPVEDQQPQATPEEKSRFERTAEVSPRAAILETRTELEAYLRDVITNNRLSTGIVSLSRHSFLQMTRILRNSNIIDSGTSALLDDLRVIGNM